MEGEAYYSRRQLAECIVDEKNEKEKFVPFSWGERALYETCGVLFPSLHIKKSKRIEVL